LPLALELAAARVPTLGVQGVRERLGERLRLLTGGARGAPSRQQTLRDALPTRCSGQAVRRRTSGSTRRSRSAPMRRSTPGPYSTTSRRWSTSRSC
jgi:hypothetical protein